MKYFCISDIHAHYTEAFNALSDAGFDYDNDNHKLIVVGDITDRGPEALEVLEWLKELTDKDKAIVLKGNHDNFLIKFFKNDNILFDWENNGLNTTIDDLDHRTNSFQTYCLLFDKPFDYETFCEWQRVTSATIQKEYPWIRKWMESFPDYYETKNYIFTHGIIDCRGDNDWHSSNMSKYHYHGWAANRWVSPEDYLYFTNKTNKHLVVGHLNASLMRYVFENKTTEGYEYKEYYPDNEIYYNKDIDTYFLDTCTIATKKVNVLVIEDEPLK